MEYDSLFTICHQILQPNSSRDNSSSSAFFKSGVMDKQCYSSSGTVGKQEIQKYALASIRDGELQCTPLAGKSFYIIFGNQYDLHLCSENYL